MKSIIRRVPIFKSYCAVWQSERSVGRRAIPGRNGRAPGPIHIPLPAVSWPGPEMQIRNLT